MEWLNGLSASLLALSGGKLAVFLSGVAIPSLYIAISKLLPAILSRYLQKEVSELQVDLSLPEDREFAAALGKWIDAKIPDQQDPKRFEKAALDFTKKVKLLRGHEDKVASALAGFLKAVDDAAKKLENTQPK